jgi:hypothetical protein
LQVSENKTKQKTYYIATLQKHRMVYKNDILAEIIYRLSSRAFKIKKKKLGALRRKN